MDRRKEDDAIASSSFCIRSGGNLLARKVNATGKIGPIEFS
jgi:hypothetical protein